MYPIISDHPDVQSRYVALRKEGQSHNMAEMLATRRSCMAKGMDRTFLEGKMHNHGLPQGFIGDKMMELARKAGVQTAGKVHISQLGPVTSHEAWVSGVDDVVRVCKKQGRGISGTVNVRGCEPPPPVQVRLAEDLVQESMQLALKKNPGKATDLRALREEVIEKHGQKKDDVNFLQKPEKRTKKVRVV